VLILGRSQPAVHGGGRHRASPPGRGNTAPDRGYQPDH
jgi:hypothetical protein